MQGKPYPFSETLGVRLPGSIFMWHDDLDPEFLMTCVLFVLWLNVAAIWGEFSQPSRA